MHQSSCRKVRSIDGGAVQCWSARRYVWTLKQDGEGEESPREPRIYTKTKGSFDRRT